MPMLIETPTQGCTAPVGVPGTMGTLRGPRGLWGALASASTPVVGAKALPVLDVTRIGAGGTPRMFAYDPDLAVSLGEELEPEDFFLA